MHIFHQGNYKSVKKHISMNIYEIYITENYF